MQSSRLAQPVEGVAGGQRHGDEDFGGVGLIREGHWHPRNGRARERRRFFQHETGGRARPKRRAPGPWNVRRPATDEVPNR